ATLAQLNYPSGVAVDNAGNLLIADTLNDRIRKVGPDGVINTVAGSGTAGFGGDGDSARTAQLYEPHRIAVDANGNLFIGDTNNNRVRKVNTAGVITTVAGNGTIGFQGDGGPAIDAQITYPSGVAIDQLGNVFIADASNNRVRVVSDGIIRTAAGTGMYGSAGDGGP